MLIAALFSLPAIKFLLSILYLKNLYKTNMNDKIITALLAILIALSGWSLTTTVGLKSDVAVLKEKVSGIENEIQNSKNFKGKKNRKKKNSNNWKIGTSFSNWSNVSTNIFSWMWKYKTLHWN